MRCVDFYKKWEKEPNWCEKTRTAVLQINSYLDLVHDIEGRGIDKEIIYAKMPEGVARPIITIKDHEIKNKILNFICSALSRSERIYPGEIKNLIASYEGKEKPEKHPEDRREVVTNVTNGSPDHEVKPPDAPIVQTLKEKYGGKDGSEHPPITDNAGKVSQSTDTPTLRESLIVPPPCQSHQPCPGGESHVFRGAELGDKCEISGAFLRDMKYCPILEQERRKAAGVKGEQFHPASMEMARTDPASRPIQHESANPSSQGIPQVKTGNPQTLTLSFSDKQWAVLKQIQREGLADGFEDAVLWLVDEKAAELESGN